MTAGSLYALGFVRAVFLAHLLLPADFGLFGLATMVASAVSIFTGYSLGTAFIPTRFVEGEHTSKALNTVWIVDFSRQALAALVIVSLSYPIATYMGQPHLMVVLVMVSLSCLITGVANPGLNVLQKDLRFKQICQQRFVTEALTSLTAVLLALVEHNYVALIWSQLAGAIVNVVTSYWVHPFRPRLEFHKASFSKLSVIGAPIFIVGVLTFVTTQFDNFVVGKALGVSILGIYLFAYRLALLPTDTLGLVFGNVLLPAFSSLERNSELGSLRALPRATAAYGVILMTALLALAIYPSELITVVYGRQWTSAAPLVRVMLLIAAFRGMAKAVAPALIAKGRADVDAKAKAVEVAIFIPGCLVLVPALGPIGAAYAGVASYCVALLLRVFAVTHLFEIDRASLLRSVFGPLFAGGLASVVGIGTKGWHPAAVCILTATTFATVIGVLCPTAYRDLLRGGSVIWRREASPEVSAFA